MNKKLSLIAVVILAATSNVDCMRAAASRFSSAARSKAAQLNKLVTERPYPAMAAALAAGAGAGFGLAYNRDRIMAAMKPGIATAHKGLGSPGASILPEYMRDIGDNDNKVEQAKAAEAELIRRANKAVPQKLDYRASSRISNGKVIITELDEPYPFSNNIISRVWDPSTNQVTYEGKNDVVNVLPNGNLVVIAKKSSWFNRNLERKKYDVIQIVDPVTNKVLFDTKEIPKGLYPNAGYKILDDRVATWVSGSDAVDFLDHDGIKLSELKHPTDPKKFHVGAFDVVPGEGFVVTFTNEHKVSLDKGGVYQMEKNLFDKNGNFLRTLYRHTDDWIIVFDK